LIAVDASALLAIAFEEPEEQLFISVLGQSAAAYIAPVNYLETGIIMTRRGFLTGRSQFETWLAQAGVVVRDDLPLATGALTAYLRFGNGFHPAKLNLADCFAYALAKSLDAPLLYKGDDFARTDIRSALQPT
jgi:ribonuclease VapC